MESLESRLETSASKVGLRCPFFMAATGRLPRRIVEDDGFTAGTDGTEFIFGRKWIESHVADDEELFGLDLHERMHVVLMHMWRRDGRDPAVWNIANDAIINANIRNMGFKIPAGGVEIPWVKYDMGSEEVYDKLMQQAQPQGGGGQGKGQGQGLGSDPRDKHGKGGWQGKGDLQDAPDEASVADIEANIRSAAQMARDCGDGSAIVDRILGTRPQASVNWKDEVRAALTSSSRDDFTYRKFSRRFQAQGLYLPALHSDAMGGLGIGFDTSGSMSQKDCDQVAGEIQGIVDDLNPDWVEVVYCDDAVTSVQRFNRGDALELKAVGGGGTRFKPVFDHFENLVEKGDKVAAMIYLTDMEGPMDELREPEWPVVWGVVYNTPQKAPFGAVVKVVVR